MHIESLEVALSPCPNDVFIVSGLILKKVPTGLEFKFYFEDIETLNRWAINKKFPVIKASFAIWKSIYSEYYLSPVGSALGFGVGPLLVGKELYPVEEFPKLKIGIPGEHTTAHLLFNFFYKGAIKKIFLRYDQIIPAILEKKVDLGILIHEGRFVYSEYRLKKLVDLGEFWEKSTGAPVPLGGFFFKRTLPDNIKNEMINAFKSSINWAENNWTEVLPLLKKYAQELKEDTIKSHVKTYVNEYTYELKNSALKGLEVLKNFLGIKETLKNLIWRE